MSDKRLSYLDNLFEQHEDDDECFDWGGGNKTKHIEIKALKEDDKKPVIKKLPSDEESVNKKMKRDSKELEQMLQFYQLQPEKSEEKEKKEEKTQKEDKEETTEKEIKEIKEEEETKNVKTKKDIMRWNKRTQTMKKEDWDAVGEEFEKSCKKLDHSNKCIIKGIKERRMKEETMSNADIKKIRSLIEDFGEKIIQPPWFVCVICRRQFKKEEELQRHCENSTFHFINCKLLEETQYEITERTLKTNSIPPSAQIQTEYPTTIPDIENNIGISMLKNMGWDEKTMNDDVIKVTTIKDRAGIGSENSSIPLQNPKH